MCLSGTSLEFQKEVLFGLVFDGDPLKANSGRPKSSLEGSGHSCLCCPCRRTPALSLGGKLLISQSWRHQPVKGEGKAMGEWGGRAAGKLGGECWPQDVTKREDAGNTLWTECQDWGEAGVQIGSGPMREIDIKLALETQPVVGEEDRNRDRGQELNSEVK